MFVTHNIYRLVLHSGTCEVVVSNLSLPNYNMYIDDVKADLGYSDSVMDGRVDGYGRIR